MYPMVLWGAIAGNNPNMLHCLFYEFCSITFSISCQVRLRGSRAADAARGTRWTWAMPTSSSNVLASAGVVHAGALTLPAAARSMQLGINMWAGNSWVRIGWLGPALRLVYTSMLSTAAPEMLTRSLRMRCGWDFSASWYILPDSSS